jgi:hypothetical protein
MRKALLLGILSLTVLSAIIISTYAVYSKFSRYGWTIQWTERGAPPCSGDCQNFTRPFQHGWRWTLENKFAKGFGKATVELSEEFKQKVISIAKSDEDVQNLLNSGYNVSSIMPMYMKLTVQENGQVLMEVDKVLLVLTKKDEYGRASVEIDFKAEKVTRITIISITVIEKSTSP